MSPRSLHRPPAHGPPPGGVTHCEPRAPTRLHPRRTVTVTRGDVTCWGTSLGPSTRNDGSWAGPVMAGASTACRWTGTGSITPSTPVTPNAGPSQSVTAYICPSPARQSMRSDPGVAGVRPESVPVGAMARGRGRGGSATVRAVQGGERDGHSRHHDAACSEAAARLGRNPESGISCCPGEGYDPAGKRPHPCC
jgi:hypothetical protein